MKIHTWVWVVVAIVGAYLLYRYMQRMQSSSAGSAALNATG